MRLLGDVAMAWKSWWNTRTMEEVVEEVVKEVVEVGGGDAALEEVVLYNTVGRLGVSMIEVRDASG